MDLEKMQKEAEALENSFISKKKAILEEMKTCKDCKETDTSFTPCDKHFKALEECSQEYLRKQMAIKLKMEMNPEETRKEIEKLQREYMKRKSCESCPHK